jgi:NADPH:quinone reductase-like Zn-dependent oxidoreductase
MKAAVIYQKDELPQYTDAEEPVVNSENEILVSVKAVAIKHFDKSRASGKHYSSETPETTSRIIGGDGVCMLNDGTRVYGMGVSGMLAEKATIEKERMVILPPKISDVTAAALPNAVIGSAMGLRFKAAVKSGEVVLINGATGFTGRVAVQIARHYGAKKIIATGRNPTSLEDLKKLGANEIISLDQGDDLILERLQKIHKESPIDIVIDYLWGHTAELILTMLKGKGSFTHKTRFVSIGAVTGDLIKLSASGLRSTDLQITGSGLGSWSKEQVQKLFTEILPEMFQLAADGILIIETIEVELKDIAGLWNLDVPDGRRLVVTI